MMNNKNMKQHMYNIPSIGNLGISRITSALLLIYLVTSSFVTKRHDISVFLNSKKLRQKTSVGEYNLVYQSDCGFIQENTIQSNQLIEGNEPPEVFTGTDLGNGVTYQWQDSTAGQAWTIITGATNINYQPLPIAKMTWYRRQATLGNCNEYSNVVILCIAIMNNIIESPTSYLVPGNAPLPIHGTLPNPAKTVFTYQWQDSTAGSSWKAIFQASEKDYNPPALSASTWFQRIVYSSCDSNTSNVVHIEVDPPPVAAFTMLNNACAGNEVLFENQSYAILGVIESYFWDFGDGSPISTEQNPGHTYEVGGMYEVTLIAVSNSAKSDTTIQTIEIFSLPYANTIEADQWVEPGSPVAVSFAGNNMGAGANYQWQDSTAETSWEDIPGQIGQNLEYAPRPWYATTLFRRSVSLNYCISTSNVVTLCIAIDNNIITNNNPPLAAGNSPLPLSGSNPMPVGSIFTYQWQQSTDGTIWYEIESATARDYSPAILAKTTLYRRIVSSSCDQDTSNVVEIIVNPPPVSGFYVPEDICQGGAVNFENQSYTVIGAIDGYLWYFGDGKSSTEKDPVHVYNTAGTFEVSLIVFSNLGKSDSLTLPITILSLPVASAGEDKTIRKGHSTQLQGYGGNNYKWRPITAMDNPDIYNPVVSPVSTTMYTVMVTDQYQCQATDSVIVTVIEDELVVRNFLTPGGDGKNDLWQILHLDLFGTHRIKIFNLWGQEVYSVTDYQNDWSGNTRGGKQLPDGFYYYVIELVEENRTYKGALTIMRD